MAKYDVPDDAWEDDEPEGPPAWMEDTSADIEIDVQLHNEGYQTDKKWTVHCHDRLDEGTISAAYAVKHRNKGNYWREGELLDDAVEFRHLPLRVRERVAAVLNRPLDEITHEHDLVTDSEDGADENE